MKLQSLAYIIITSRSILTTAKSIRGGATNSNGNIENVVDDITNANSDIDTNDERDLQGTIGRRPHRLFPQGVDPEFRNLQELEGPNQILKKDARIIGGTGANDAEYDYTVSMQDNQGHFCGGSLITPNMILTAAHCLGGSYDVIIGKTRNINSGGGQSIAMDTEIRHPQYNSQKTINDFALLILKNPVDMTDSNVGLVKLNTQSSTPAVNSYVTVVGWGETQASTRGLSKDLLEVDVQVISNSDCDKSSGSVGGYSDNYNGQIKDSMLCARIEGGGKDACQGDSGGPLVVKTGNQHTQVGVVSWGIGCASAAFPGVYSRVSDAFDWIEGEVCDRSVGPIPAEFDCGSGNNGNGNPSTPPPTPSPVSSGNNISPSNEKWRTVFADDFTKTHDKGGKFLDGGKDARWYPEAKGIKGILRLQNGKNNAKRASVFTEPMSVKNYSKCRAVVDFMLIGMQNNDEWCVEYSERGTENSFQTASCFGTNNGFNVKRWFEGELAEFSVKNMDEVTLRLRCNSNSRKKDVLLKEAKFQCN